MDYCPIFLNTFFVLAFLYMWYNSYSNYMRTLYMSMTNLVIQAWRLEPGFLVLPPSSWLTLSKVLFFSVSICQMGIILFLPYRLVVGCRWLEQSLVRGGHRTIIWHYFKIRMGVGRIEYKTFMWNNFSTLCERKAPVYGRDLWSLEHLGYR